MPITPAQFMTILIATILAFVLIGATLVFWSVSFKKQATARVQFLELEILNRKQTEQTLQQSNDKFLSLLAHAPGYIAYVNANTLKYEIVNNALAQSFGIPREKIIGSHIKEIIGETNFQFAKKYLAEVRAGKAVSYENTFDLVSGKRWVDVNYAPVFDSNGLVTSIVVFSFDITLRKQAEESVRESQNRYQLVFENSGTANAIFDTGCRLILQNSLSLQNLGTNPGDPQGQTALELFGPEQGAIVTERMRRVLVSGITEYFETAFDLPVGKRWFRSTYQPIFDEQHTLLGVQVISQDISAQKQVENDLRESEFQLSRAQHFAHIGSWTWNIKTNQLTWSDEMYNIFGLDKKTFTGDIQDVIAQTIHPDDRAEVDRSNISVIQKGLPIPVEYRIVWADGSVRTVWAEAGELARDKTGAPALLSGTVQDITQRKQAENLIRQYASELELRVEQRTADLSRVNAELARALRASDEFLASTSHELRTPLTSILGLSESLQLQTYGSLNERQQKTLKIIEESGRHLLELINDILDLSKIQSGKLDLKFGPCSIADVCEAGLQMTKGMANQKRQNVSYTPGAWPVTVQADGRRLKQILVNLLGNAIKFTPEDGELGLEVQADETEHVVRLTVWDKGIGIQPEELSRIFKPFVQLDGGLERQYPGSGLGLSLVQRLTEMHNGRISVESVFGAGSRFTVTLPWEPQAGASILEKSQTYLGGNQ
jgi:PAS domain S-box-containing protein